MLSYPTHAACQVISLLKKGTNSGCDRWKQELEKKTSPGWVGEWHSHNSSTLRHLQATPGIA